VSRVRTAERAAELIDPGMTIGLGGLQGNHPMTMIRAVAGSGVRHLRVVGPPVGMAAELLIATGAVVSLAAPYMGAEGVIGVAPAYRAAVESGQLELWECDEAILLAALRAAAQDLPYLPWRGGAGTDVVRLNPALTEYVDEATGTTLVRVPRLDLDVALVRGLEADRFGNVRYAGHSYFADQALARAAGLVIAEVERLVDHQIVIDQPERTVHHRVDAVVVAPNGSHPFRAAGVIDQDDRWLVQWAAGIKKTLSAGESIADAEVLAAALAPGGHDAYLESIGAARIEELTAPFRG
jgi:glutaconate CoA-transferase subunit A